MNNKKNIRYYLDKTEPAEQQIQIYQSSLFFSDSFDFVFRRFIHTPQQYNKNILHRREFWKIVFVEDGAGEKFINNEVYPFSKGSIFLIRPEDVTAFEIRTKTITICNFLFTPRLIENTLTELNDDFGFFSSLQAGLNPSRSMAEVLYIEKSDSTIKKLVRTLEDEYTNKNKNYRIAIKSCLSQLLVAMDRKFRPRKKINSPKVITEYVLHIINEYYTEEFNLEYICQQIGISKNHLCRIFNETTGTTILTVLKRKRIAEAEKLLLHTNELISTICFYCGFNDLSYFYRCFKEEMGSNPGTFRKKHRYK